MTTSSELLSLPDLAELALSSLACRPVLEERLESLVVVVLLVVAEPLPALFVEAVELDIVLTGGALRPPCSSTLACFGPPEAGSPRSRSPSLVAPGPGAEDEDERGLVGVMRAPLAMLPRLPSEDGEVALLLLLPVLDIETAPP